MIDTRSHSLFAPAILSGAMLLIAACDTSGVSGRDDHCDDGTQPSCEMVPPDCTGGQILAYQNSCYVCVDPATCTPGIVDPCTADSECGDGEFCDPCGTSSCPMCADCVPACRVHDCEGDGSAIMCFMERPECGDYGVAVEENGCWICVDVITCEPARNEQCDDGTVPACLMPVPDCGPDEILAHQDSCYVCVNPATCEPWGQPGCAADVDCADTDYCDPCGSSSCPGCDDCLPACLPHGCPTESYLECNAVRPECGDNGVAVIENGCWACKDLQTCEPARSEQCDDGTQPLCNMPPPDCLEHEILAHQDNCYVCVNPTTCEPWGEPGCSLDADCDPEDQCDPCGSSSCPECDDCVPACVPHGCPTEPQALCYMMRPECAAGEVAIVENGCWVCVDEITCQ